MSKILIALFLGISLTAEAADCLDLSGDYSAPASRIPEKRRVFTIRQTACDSIAVGSYSIVNGAPAEEIQPRILYVNEARRDLCAKCVGFAVVNGGLEIKVNTTVPVNKLHCAYKKVKWSLKGRDLAQTYYLTGSPSQCKRVGSTFTKVLDRFR